jgi:hypothetical protein
MTYTTESNYTQSVSGNRDFNVGFPFLATTDLKVQKNGTTVSLTSDYTIVQSGANTTINFNTAPAVNDTVRIFRDTDIDAIEATYTAGSAIRASDLNTNNKQLLYAAQEFGTLKTDNSVSFSLGNKGDIQINSSTDYVINNNAIELAMMANNSVGTNELVNDSVTVDKIADNAIVTAGVQDNAITNSKMADNSVNTSEIVNSAITLAKLADATLTAIQTTYSNPVGTVIWYAGSSAPTGYLKCNGSSIPNGTGTVQGITADFSALYAIIGALTPDLRGEFIRGWDDGRAVDGSRAIRSTQVAQNKQHTHGINISSTSTVTDPGHIHSIDFVNNKNNFGVAEESGEGSPNGTNNSNSSTTGISVSTSSTGTILNEGGENRPRNVALLACIKY